MKANIISQLSRICMNEMRILIACIDTQPVHQAPLAGAAAWVIDFGDNSISVIDQPYPTEDSMYG